MSTVTIEQPVSVNFLITNKCADWRCGAYERFRGDEHRKTTHWIGIIDLLPIRKQKTQYPISYVKNFTKIVEDEYMRRDVDGYELDYQTTLYYLSGIIENLLQQEMMDKISFMYF